MNNSCFDFSFEKSHKSGSLYLCTSVLIIGDWQSADVSRCEHSSCCIFLGPVGWKGTGRRRCLTPSTDLPWCPSRVGSQKKPSTTGDISIKGVAESDVHPRPGELGRGSSWSQKDYFQTQAIQKNITKEIKHRVIMSEELRAGSFEFSPTIAWDQLYETHWTAPHISLPQKNFLSSSQAFPSRLVANGVTHVSPVAVSLTNVMNPHS